MLAFLKRIYDLAILVQLRIGQFCTGLPFWKDVEKFSMIIAGPVKGVAGLALRIFPFLRRFEAYLEIESLRKRPPVILALSIVFLAYRGIHTTPNGHIGTDIAVFPFLTLVSCFNPFLGALCAVAFSVADFLQKLVHPDIYGAMQWSDPNYPGAMLGYVAAYSITLWMGVMPGLVSRIGRKIAISIFLKIRASRAARHADGATPALTDPAMDAVGLLGNMLGAVLTGYTGVKLVAPVLEWPAFHWRPTPDLSCYRAELVALDASANRSGLMGIVGGAIAATTAAGTPPPPPGTPPPPPPGTPPPPLDPEAERVRQRISELEEEAASKQQLANVYRSKLINGDPRQREHYLSEIRPLESRVSSCRDNIEALKGDDVLRHTKTALDAFNQLEGDCYVREARDNLIKAKNDLLNAKIEHVNKTAKLLALNLEQQQAREAGSRYYTEGRDEFFRTLLDKAGEAMKGKDLDKMVADLDRINEIIERQGRPTFEPKKTTQDRVEDAVMRGVAVTVDMALTKGAMNALVSGFQTARDGVLSGMSEGEALTRGTIQGAVEAATAGVGAYAGRLGMNQALVMAGTNAAIGAATSLRDGLEQGKSLFSAAARALGDGAFAGGTSYVTDKVSDIALVKAMPYVNTARNRTLSYVDKQLKPYKPYIDKVKAAIKVPNPFRSKPAPLDLSPEVAGKLNAARGNIVKGPNGQDVLTIDDVKTLMRDSRTGRVLKPGPEELSDLTKAYDNTMNNLKAAHDARTADDFLKENPLTPAQQARGAVRKKIEIDEFNTPGKPPSRSVDRDQRMMETLYNEKGEVISKSEVPRHKWENLSRKNFAEATNYNEADFRKTLSAGDQQTFDGLKSQSEKLKFYQEKHGWKCTDKFHAEASIDNSDQIIDPKTNMANTATESRILRVKGGECTLKDAQGEGLMYQEKVRDALGSEQPVEAFAQAKKGVTAYKDIREGLQSQRLDPGTVRPGMQKTMSAINRYGDAAAQGNAEAINKITAAMRENGYKNLNDFMDKLGGHFESLKFAKPKPGQTCGGSFYPYLFNRDE